MPKVSVIMCVYNGEKHLREAIESILNQTFTDFEFIIINDCSTDTSQEIIRSYADTRIMPIENTANIGLAASLNIGLQTAEGDYIVRMDADDVCLPKRIALQVDFMEQHPATGVAGSWIKVFGDADYYWKPKANSKYLQCKLLFNTPLPHPTWIVRHDLIKEHNLYYSQTMRRAQDYDYLVRVSQYAQLGCIQQCLLNYRSEQVTRNPVNHNEALKNIFNVRKQQLQKLGIEVTEKEHELHHQLSESRFKNPLLNPFEVGRWLTKLVKANRENKVFSAYWFNTLIGELWVQTIFNTLPRGIGAKLSFPALWLPLVVSLWQQLRYKIAK